MKTYRLLIAAMLTVLAGVAWYAFAEPDRAGVWVLGLYRRRWFVACAGLTYLALWATVLAVWTPGLRGLARVGLVHLGLISGLTAVEGLAFLGVLDLRTLVDGPSRAPDPEHRLRWVSPPNLAWEGYVAADLTDVLGIEAERVPVSIVTDSYGHRNPPGKTNPDVYCIGDSILAAMLVPLEEIVTERLQDQTGLQVMNVSEAGYSLQEELIRFERNNLPLDGRLVLHFVFEGNDLSDSAQWRAWCEAGAIPTWPDTGLFATFIQLLRWPNRGAAAGRHGVWAHGSAQPLDVYFAYDAQAIDEGLPELEVIATSLLQARDWIVSSGALYAIVFVPTKLRVLGPFCTWPEESALADPRAWRSGFPAALRELCRSNGIPYLDLSPSLEGVLQRGELPYFWHDTHLNSVGHSAIAKTLAEWVMELRSGGGGGG